MQGDPPDVLEVARPHPLERELLAVLQSSPQLGPHDHAARVGDGGDPAGEVHGRPVGVALTLEHGPPREAHAHVGERLGITRRFGQAQRDLHRGERVLDEEHHLVADHLDHAPAAGDDHVVGQLLELVDDHRQLLVADLLGQRGEADEVGEPDDEPRILVALGPQQATAGGHLEVAAPHLLEHRGEHRQEPAGLGGQRLEDARVLDVGGRAHGLLGARRSRRRRGPTPRGPSTIR